MSLHIETEINAPAQKVWEILAHDFAGMAKWTTTLSDSREITGSEIPAGIIPAGNAPVPARETTSAIVTAIEVITKYSEENRELMFEAANLPMMLSSARNRQQVAALGDNKSKVSFDIDLQLRGIFKVMAPILKRRFSSTMGNVQQELKTYAETGQLPAV